MNIRVLPIVITAALALAACGGATDGAASNATVASTAATVQTSVPTDASTPSTTPDQRAVVTIAQSRFGVLELRVAPGTTVTFENDDPYAHTITSTDASPMAFNSGELNQGDTFEVTFDEAGEYAYFCQIHPTMRAVVIVG